MESKNKHLALATYKTGTGYEFQHIWISDIVESEVGFNASDIKQSVYNYVRLQCSTETWALLNLEYSPECDKQLK